VINQKNSNAIMPILKKANGKLNILGCCKKDWYVIYQYTPETHHDPIQKSISVEALILRIVARLTTKAQQIIIRGNNVI
jgi:hypothetical protein